MDLDKRGGVMTTSNDDERKAYRFKLVMLGFSGAGKTSLLTRLIKNKFTETLSISVGAVFHTQTFIMDGKNIKIDSKYDN